MTHASTMHPLTIWELQATKLGFLSLPLPFPRFRIRLSVSACPSHTHPYWFSAECSHGGPFCYHRGSPLPADPHTGIRKESQPIFNSLPTHTSSTAPTISTSPILQELADSWSPNPIVSTCQLHGNKRE